MLLHRLISPQPIDHRKWCQQMIDNSHSFVTLTTTSVYSTMGVKQHILRFICSSWDLCLNNTQLYITIYYRTMVMMVLVNMAIMQ